MKDRILLSKQIPPIYETLRDKFGVDWDSGLIIAFDGRIHSKETPQPQKIIHEEVHLKRQNKIGNEVWWKLYIENEKFRLDEEILAYMAEAKFLKKNIKDRELLFHLKRELAYNMSNEMYGNIISLREALSILI